jgi:ribosomal protein L23
MFAAVRNSLARSTRAVAAGPTRSLATVVSASFDPPTTRSSPVDSALPLPDNNRVVLPKPSSSSTLPPDEAPRYSKDSSRLLGRTQRKPRKATSPTELNPDGLVGERLPAVGGQVKVFLPSVFMRLVRNTGEHKDDPFTATFRTHLELTKPDISNYLKNVYGLHVTSIRTINYLAKLKRNPIGGGVSRSGGTKNYKKVMVTMTEPFWYPEERSRAWLNEHFERDRMEEMRDRKMLKIGDGRKHGVGSQRYRGANKSREERERLKKVSKEGGNDLTAREQGEDSSLKKPTGLRKRTNVLKSRAEAISEKQTALEVEMERLREAGW